MEEQLTSIAFVCCLLFISPVTFGLSSSSEEDWWGVDETVSRISRRPDAAPWEKRVSFSEPPPLVSMGRELGAARRFGRLKNGLLRQNQQWEVPWHTVPRPSLLSSRERWLKSVLRSKSLQRKGHARQGRLPKSGRFRHLLDDYRRRLWQQAVSSFPFRGCLH